MPDPFVFPRMIRVRQRFPLSQPIDLPAVVAAGFRRRKLHDQVPPGARIAVGIGSRGIANIAGIAKAVLDALRSAGLDPFIVPAMGSHGGATPEGQRTILADYGITESTVGTRIEASMAVTRLGRTIDGIDVWTSQAALDADGIVLVNRVKPHTDFTGELGSGLVKMSVVGLGNRQGAVTFHAAASRLGHLAALRSLAAVTLGQLPILAGVAVIEGFHHETARIDVLPRDEILVDEPALVTEAGRLLPRLPFDDIDLLVVDRIGKDISGTGMDANVTGRYVHGYQSSLRPAPSGSQTIRRILVRDLTKETRGNAIGIGMADFTTTRLVRSMDLHATYTNALTSLSVQAAKVPIHFESDREALAHALRSVGLPDPAGARIVRIVDTLSLVELQASEALEAQARERQDLELLGPSEPMTFDNHGNLAPMPAN
jgi:hypothetical protein